MSDYQKRRAIAIVNKRKLSELSEEEMGQVINNLAYTEKMRNDMYMGIEFLQWLLKNYGVRETASVVEKGAHIIDKEGEINVYDFEGMHPTSPQVPGKKDTNPETPAEKSFNHVGSNRKMNRRDWLQTMGWIVPGVITLGYGAFKTTDEGVEVYKTVTGQMKTPPPDAVKEEKASVFGRIAEFIENYAVPPGEVIIGAALVQEGFNEWKEIKLDQIANAIGEMAEVAGLQNNGTSRRWSR